MTVLLKLKSQHLFLIYFLLIALSVSINFFEDLEYLANIWGVFHLFWLFSITNYLQKKLNIEKFQKWKYIYIGFALIIMLTLLFTSIILSLDMFKEMVILIGLFTFLGIIMMAFVSAKSLVLLKDNNFFILNFVLCWFFPIGIWIIQPKLNDFLNKDND
jgi:hypothetical protein